MTLWRLEFVRLTRTGRILILIAVFLAMGLLGPLTIYYLPEILEASGGDSTAFGELAPVTIESAMAAFLGNAIQFGLLAVAFVAAAALAIDAKPEIAVFFRSRASIPQILLPRYFFNAAGSVIGFIVGVVTAVVTTGLLIGWPDAFDTIVATVLVAVYLLFVVGLIALFGSLVRKVPATALLTIGAVILLAIIGNWDPIQEYQPGHLVAGFDRTIAGGDFTYWPAIVVTLLVTAGCLWIAKIRLEAREV